jgi:LuxR family maltose regulon positive regulatory protein
MAVDATLGARGSSTGALLATKLHVPWVKPGYVARRRLIDQLNDGAGQDLILVSAPAGFGKTTLLAEWCAEHPEVVAWLSLDRGDNDPARFWRHVAAAVDRVHPGTAERAEGMLGPGSGSLDGVVTALINEVAGDGSELIAVLDDYHVIEHPRVHASMAFLLEHLPPGMQVVIASRSDPPLPLPRIRVSGRLTEVRAADLRFTRGETVELLRETVGTATADESAGALTDRTEGWVAGLQLAALSLRTRPAEAFVAGFSGNHRYVLDYLAEEVLDQQPAEVRTFLIETSIVDRLSGELCDAVTGRSDGQAMLEHIERANLFLIPLDDIRQWWRYHHLFSDLLQARLADERPERVVALHRAAAAWHDDHDLADEAVQHALAAGDPSWAARLVERHADTRLQLCEGTTLRRWLEALPGALVASRPRLLLAEANLALVSGDTEAFEGPFVAAERAVAAAPDAIEEPYEPSGGRAASLLSNVPAAMALGRAHLAELSGDAEATTEFALQAQHLLDASDWMLDILTRAHVAVAALLGGRLEEAEAGFLDEIALCRRTGERVVLGRAAELCGLAQRFAGRLDDALATFRLALEGMVTPSQASPPAAGRVHAGMADIAYQRNDLTASMRTLDDAIDECRQLADAINGSPQPLANALATLAWVRHAQGDAVGARAAMAEAVDNAPAPDVTSLLNPVPAQAARLQLAHGDIDAAARWAEMRGLTPDATASFPREPEYLVLARVLIALDRENEAVAMLDRFAVEARDRAGSLIEIGTLRALALSRAGRAREAMDALADAVARARRGGWVRVFLDEGEPMVALLQRLADRQVGEVPRSDAIRWDAAAMLRAHASPPWSRSDSSLRRQATSELIEPLTEREIEVLQLLATGRPNREIAAELFVTLDTIKKHVTHIFEKLGVTNRTEAAARARSLGLLADHERIS